MELSKVAQVTRASLGGAVQAQPYSSSPAELGPLWASLPLALSLWPSAFGHLPVKRIQPLCPAVLASPRPRSCLFS